MKLRLPLKAGEQIALDFENVELASSSFLMDYLVTLVTISIGHKQVRDDERGRRLSELAESFSAITRLHDPVPRLFQHLPKERPDLLVVVNGENGGRRHGDVVPGVVTASRVTDAPTTSTGQDW